jgi:hypothetical protein
LPPSASGDDRGCRCGPMIVRQRRSAVVDAPGRSGHRSPTPFAYCPSSSRGESGRWIGAWFSHRPGPHCLRRACARMLHPIRWPFAATHRTPCAPASSPIAAGPAEARGLIDDATLREPLCRRRRRSFVTVDGVASIHLRDEGSGPVLLLLNGHLGSLRMWDGWSRNSPGTSASSASTTRPTGSPVPTPPATTAPAVAVELSAQARRRARHRAAATSAAPRTARWSRLFFTVERPTQDRQAGALDAACGPTAAAPATSAALAAGGRGGARAGPLPAARVLAGAPRGRRRRRRRQSRLRSSIDTTISTTGRGAKGLGRRLHPDPVPACWDTLETSRPAMRAADAGRRLLQSGASMACCCPGAVGRQVAGLLGHCAAHLPRVPRTRDTCR